MKIATDCNDIVSFKKNTLLFDNYEEEKLRLYKIENSNFYDFDSNCYGGLDSYKLSDPFFFDYDKNIVGIINYQTLEIEKFSLENIEINKNNLHINRVISTENNCYVEILQNVCSSMTKSFIHIYDIKTKKLLNFIDMNSNLIAVHPNDNIIIFGSSKKQPFLYGVKEKKILSLLNYPYESIWDGKFTPDGKYLFLMFDPDSNYYARVYDFENYSFMHDLGKSISPLIYNSAINIYLSSDNQYALIITTDRCLLVFETKKDKFIGSTYAIHSLSYDHITDKIAYILSEKLNIVIVENFKDFIEKLKMKFSGVYF